jgi:hypothetical protein
MWVICWLNDSNLLKRVIDLVVLVFPCSSFLNYSSDELMHCHRLSNFFQGRQSEVTNWLHSLISASLEKLVPLQLRHVSVLMHIVSVLASKGFPSWSSNWIPAGTWFWSGSIWNKLFLFHVHVISTKRTMN